MNVSGVVVGVEDKETKNGRAYQVVTVYDETAEKLVCEAFYERDKADRQPIGLGDQLHATVAKVKAWTYSAEGRAAAAFYRLVLKEWSAISAG